MEDLDALYQKFLECRGGVVTDSRHPVAESMFFALKGENFDGNRFAADALVGGCHYAVVDNAEVVPSDGSEQYLLVENALEALRLLAFKHRKRLNTRIIGVTGTNGKTTTKELLRAVLEKKYRVSATEGNLNNDIGVPLTLLRLRPEHEIGIIEMGASHPGDIRRLAEVADPDFGIVTNVGEAHLQGFGSLEGVARTKGELYDFLRAKSGTQVFLNADDALLCRMAAGMDTVTYGSSGSATVWGEAGTSDPFLSFSWKEAAHPSAIHRVHTHLVGAYNFQNALAACAVGVRFRVPPEDICAAIENYKPISGRSRLVETGHNKVVADAYNANPTSMEAALRNFAAMASEHKMAVLGDMKELGSASYEEHCRILNLAAGLGIDPVIAVGPEFTAAVTSCEIPVRCCPDAVTAGKLLQKLSPEGFLVLLKGSHSMNLESLLPLF